MKRPWLLLLALVAALIAAVGRTRAGHASVAAARAAATVERAAAAPESSKEEPSQAAESAAPVEAPREEGETVHPRSLVWLASAQSADGSWRGGTEVVGAHGNTKTAATSLALLAWFGAATRT